jgi:D-apionolactonase
MHSVRSETFQCHGQADPPPPLLALQAGPLEIGFDRATGFLRRIRRGGREVLRGIYAAVRDHNWGTAPAEVCLTVCRIETDSFHLEFECTHRHAEIDFVWHGTVVGGADGTVRYAFDGEARSAFRTNRIGFCVLHPIRECAGAMARQFLTDGSEREVRFPRLIEPQIFGQSPFKQLRGIRHEVESGVWAQVDFEGDVFEMEDQRNWTDASFKTYCTPLLEPFPVMLGAGDRIHQVVTLRLLGAAAAHRPGRPAPAVVPTLLIPGAPDVMLPRLGVGVASHGGELTAEEVSRLRALGLSHLRIDLHLATPDAGAKLDQAAREAAQLEVPLELALHLPAAGAVESTKELRRILGQVPGRLVRVLALREGELATTTGTLNDVRRSLGDCGVPVGAGSDCNFRELNHEHAVGRLGLTGADFVFWSVTPQVHAYDHRSVMETLEAQPATVYTARALAGERPLVVSPVTLRQRFNPLETAAAIPPAAGELPASVDPRQLSQFAAAWTLASIAALAAAGVDSATYFETTGWRGVMERAKGPALPKKFPSVPGEIFPVFHVLAGLAGFRRAAVATAEHVAAVALFSPAGRTRLLVANLVGESRRIRLEGWGRPRILDLAPYVVEHLEAGV